MVSAEKSGKIGKMYAACKVTYFASQNLENVNDLLLLKRYM